jgi:hypothetical protein
MWLREDETPYYVGKGKGNRAYEVHRVANRKSCAPPKGRIVFYIAKDEDDAFEIEELLIWYYGRKDLGTGCLRNLSNGGNKPPTNRGKEWHPARRAAHKPRVAWNRGVHPSEETIEKMRIASTGRVISIETRAKMGKSISEARRLRPYGLGRVPWNKGSKGTQVAWNKGTKGATAWNKGKKASKETRLKQSVAKLGKKLTADHKKSLSEAKLRTGNAPPNRKGIKQTPEHIAKRVAARMEKGNYAVSEDDKRKISEATKLAMESPEVKAKLGSGTRGKPWSEARRKAQENTHVNA